MVIKFNPQGKVLMVTVDANGTLPNVSSLQAFVMNAGQSATPSIVLDLAGAPTTIPPAQSFSLGLRY